MPLIPGLPEFITPQILTIFVVFIVVVVVLYKGLKVLFHAFLFAIAAFSFPWIAKALGFAIDTSIQTAVYFMLAGLGLFFIYEFFHFVVYFFRILSWPFRTASQKKKEKELKKYEKEVKELEEKEESK